MLISMPQVIIDVPETLMKERLEEILEGRDKGPFVRVPDDLVERVMEQAVAGIREREAHS